MLQHANFQSLCAHPRDSLPYDLHIQVILYFAKYHYIFNIHFTYLRITEGGLCFSLIYMIWCLNAHWESIIIVLSMWQQQLSYIHYGSKYLFFRSPISIQYRILLEIFQWLDFLHRFTYSRHDYESINSCLV